MYFSRTRFIVVAAFAAIALLISALIRFSLLPLQTQTQAQAVTGPIVVASADVDTDTDADTETQIATVTITGQSSTAELTVTVIDTDDTTAAPIADVPSSTSTTPKQIVEPDIKLPTTRQVLIEAGQQLQVTVDNGTAATPLDVSIDSAGQIVRGTTTGTDAVVTVQTYADID